MNWILDHLQLVFVLGGAIAWWLNQRNRAKNGEEAPAPPPEAAFDDPELAERTRRIREEIQRKIEQRARGYAHEQPTLPRSEPEAPPVIREVTVAKSQPRTASRTEVQRQAEILEEQAAMMEKLREAETLKAAALKRTEFEKATADHSGEARTASRATVLVDLRSPDALRRAFILREVLGPPVALR